MNNITELSGMARSRQPSIFISHSSKEIVLARAVRNLLEDRNHHFVDLIGLASLEGKSTVQQFQFLLDEINSRDWLVLIDSESARDSKYVQFEISVAKILRKPFYVIRSSRFNVEGRRIELESRLRPCIESLSRGLRVFLSFSARDGEIVNRVANWLDGKAYEVFTDAVLRPGVPWKRQIEDEIQKAAEHGVMIVLLSNSWRESKWANIEVELAQSMNGRVLGVVFEQFDYSLYDLDMTIIDVTRYDSFEDKMLRIWRELNETRHKIFNEHCGDVDLHEWAGVLQNN